MLKFRNVALALTLCLASTLIFSSPNVYAKVKKKTVTLYKGENYSIKLKGSSKKYKIKWSTSKKSVVKIVGKANKPKCKFKAVKKGKSTIKLKINGKVYYKYTFKVKALKPIISDEPASTSAVSSTPANPTETPIVNTPSEAPNITPTVSPTASPSVTAPVIDFNPSEPSVSDGPQYEPSIEPTLPPADDEEISYRSYQKTVSVHDEQVLSKIATGTSLSVNDTLTEFSGGSIISGDAVSLSLPDKEFKVNSSYTVRNEINDILHNNVLLITAYITDKDDFFDNATDLWKYSSSNLYLGLNVTSMAAEKKVNITTGSDYISIYTTELHDLKNKTTNYDVIVYSYEFYCNGFAIRASSTDKAKMDKLISQLNTLIN